MRLPMMLFGLAMGLWACGSSSETAATASVSGTNASSTASSGAGGQGGASSSGSSMSSGQGGSAGQGGSVGAAQCMTICDTQAQLVCPGFEHAACVADCESLAEVAPWCMTTTDAFNACLAAQPTNSFVCDPETAGDVDAKPGVCSADVDAVRDCWFEGPSGGLPDLSAAVASICTEQKSLPCAHASCVSDYTALLAESAKCNGAWAAMFACVAKIPDKQWGCNNGNPKLLNDGGACEFQLALVFACEN